LVAKRKTPDSPVFIHNVNRKTQTAVNFMWLSCDQARFMKQACKAAGLEPIAFHELRHTYVSLLISGGCLFPYIAKQLGHSDTRMVELHYGHIRPSEQREAIKMAMPELGIVEISKIQKLKISS
jgi:integrase